MGLRGEGKRILKDGEKVARAGKLVGERTKGSERGEGREVCDGVR